MQRFIIICLIICSSSFGLTVATAQFLSPNAEISLLTAAPGEELYSVFGHSAIRIKDISTGQDVLFNYGLFDYDAPNFYLNFARGRMNYCLGVERYEHFVAAYAAENRNIREQVFNLDSTQREFIIHFLENNYRPENRNYLYHFFLDNCATRIRDIVLLTYDGLVLPEAKENPTYRDLIHRYLQSHPWGRFGIDIALGLPTDQKTNAYEQMFLPDYLFDVFAQATYHGQPIIETTRNVFVSDKPAIQPPGIITPMLACSFVLMLALLFCFVKKGAKAFDVGFFLIIGLVGLAVFMLWFFTDHTNTRNNLNIIWALPTHLVMVFFLLPNKRFVFVRKYFLVTAVISVLLLIAWALLPQKLNPALIPLVIAIALRSYCITTGRSA